MSKIQKIWRRFTKKELDIMRFRLYVVNFDLTCEGHPKYSRAYFMNIMNCFNDH